MKNQKQKLGYTENGINKEKKLLSISEFRREVGIPLVLAKKMISWGEIEVARAFNGTILIASDEACRVKILFKNRRRRVRYYLRALGPGIITGASDDDPSGIATYSAAGAKFGFALLWMAAWLLPMMIAIQEVCARIGIVTNKGLSKVLLKHYKRRFVFLIVAILIIANVINISANLGAMAASARMLTGLNYYFLAIVFSAIILFSEIFLGYHRYVRFLKWLTFSLFAYIFAGFVVKPDWLLVLRESFIPEIRFEKDYIFAIIAIFGTTISPYLFFWQTSEEVEENKVSKIFKKNPSRGRIKKMRMDVSSGMVLANVVSFFIILTTAQVLFKNGITEINSAEEAALALRPFVGHYAHLVFALGIIGTGLLAIPILATSGAYALSEVMNWKEGLDYKFSKAKGFYLIIIISVLLGLVANFFNINPIMALYFAAFANGIIALPLMIVIMIVGNNSKIMGKETHPIWVKFFGWLAVVFMTLSIIALIILNII